jgi:HB1, ASXL, restriction endonuclease HTH domain
MWYGICMVSGTKTEAERLYVDSLRWRQQDLQAKVEDVGVQIAELTKREAELKQQLRAVHQLLTAEGATATGNRAAAHSSDGSVARVLPSDPIRDSGDARLDFSAWSPRARGIYESAAQAIREAGVPLHYRVIAEEVQKRVPISGADAGATLIAHLHRAQDMFPRVGRGIYGLQGMVEVAGADRSPSATPAGRRRRTRRRSV